MANNSLLAAALAYAAQGLIVLPMHGATGDGRCTCGDRTCKSIAKHPRVSWKPYQNRAPDAKRIKQWWTKWPTANVGLITGAASGLVVVDIDGEAGWQALADAGIDLTKVRTPTAVTGRGTHVYVQYPTGARIETRAGVLPKVDIRADGGLVVAPPSVHASGRVYAWEEGLALGDLELAETDLAWAAQTPAPAPVDRGAWRLGVADAIDPRVRTAANVALAAIAEATEGERHAVALEATARLAGFVNNNLADEDILLAKALMAWRACGETDAA